MCCDCEPTDRVQEAVDEIIGLHEKAVSLFGGDPAPAIELTFKAGCRWEAQLHSSPFWGAMGAGVTIEDALAHLRGAMVYAAQMARDQRSHDASMWAEVAAWRRS